MSEFTKGPWRQGNVVELLLNRKCREIISDDGKIGLVYGIIDQDNKANANLIAAAPELYEACEEALANDIAAEGEGASNMFLALREKLEAALKKARGE
jgi:hypothetical protein